VLAAGLDSSVTNDWEWLARPS